MGFKSIINTFIKEIEIKRQAPVSFPISTRFARFSPFFLLSKCLFFARFFIKLSPFEELATLGLMRHVQSILIERRPLVNLLYTMFSTLLHCAGRWASPA